MGNIRETLLDPMSHADHLRLVVLSPFFLDQTEVSVKALRDAGFRPGPELELEPWSGRSTGDNWNDFCGFTSTPSAKDTLPINCIAPHKARLYCQKMGADLPTEAQFEYVAGALTSRRYVWGDDPPAPAPKGCSDAVLAQGGWGAYGSMQPFNCKPATPPGGPQALGSLVSSPRRDRLELESGTVFDLVGNVSEFALDTWNTQDDPCWSKGGVYVDPVCGDGSPMNDHVIRGGSWIVQADNAAAATRAWYPGGAIVSNDIGFRCARPAN
jgi:formylglycine-generating enzyme required for sulfatase activity